MTNQKKPRRRALPAAEVATVPIDPQSGTAAAEIAKRLRKRERVLELMRCEGGASLTAIIAATGWLPHTARAALTGLRKKGHIIEKSKADGETRYSVIAGSAK